MVEDVTDTFNSDRQEKQKIICNRVISIGREDVCPSNSISMELVKEYEDVPEAFLQWGKKLVSSGYNGVGLEFVTEAFTHAEHDEAPDRMRDRVLQVLAQHNQVGIMEVMLKEEEEKHPENVYLKNSLGQFYIAQRRISEAIDLLKSFVDDGNGDNATESKLGHAYLLSSHPEEAVTLFETMGLSRKEIASKITKSASACIQRGTPEDTLPFLNMFIESGQGDVIITNTLGNAYLHLGKPDDAIKLLKPLCDSGEGNKFTTGILSNAYLHSGKPDDAIKLLKLNEDDGDDAKTRILANAYVLQKNRKAFDLMKVDIEPPIVRDYLDAKLYYLEGFSRKARAIIQQHMHEKARSHIIGLFMACSEGKQELHTVLKDQFGARFSGKVKKISKAWISNSLQVELKAGKVSSGNKIFDLGALPISRSERIKAGLDSSVPVSAINTFWNEDHNTFD